MEEKLNLITDEEVNTFSVASAPTILNGTPQENKYIFDKLCREVVIPKLNALITAHMNVDEKVDDSIAEIHANRENIQELSETIPDASCLVPKNQGSDNVGKFLVVGEDGNVALTDKINNENFNTSELLPKNQGVSNVGKILVVGADGNVTLADMPYGQSCNIIGVVGENNEITLTGDLADGTYVFRYENVDGGYSDIGTLVVGELFSIQ